MRHIYSNVCDYGCKHYDRLARCAKHKRVSSRRCRMSQKLNHLLFKSGYPSPKWSKKMSDSFLTGCMVPPAMTTARHSFSTVAKCTAGLSKRNLRLLWVKVPRKISTFRELANKQLKSWRGAFHSIPPHPWPCYCQFAGYFKLNSRNILKERWQQMQLLLVPRIQNELGAVI